MRHWNHLLLSIFTKKSWESNYCLPCFIKHSKILRGPWLIKCKVQAHVTDYKANDALASSLPRYLIYLFIYLFNLHWRTCLLILEGGEGREKGKERNTNWLLLTCPRLGTWPRTQAYALTGNLTLDLSVYRMKL